MRFMAETLKINLAERSYAIHIAADLGSEVRHAVMQRATAGRRVAVLTDTNFAQAQSAALRAMFGETPVLIVEPGEGSKSLAGLGRVLDFLAEHKIDRGGALFAVGGGVIGDLGDSPRRAGCAGLIFSGADDVARDGRQLGGRENRHQPRGRKNLAGAFHQPRGVFISTNLLATLPPREFSAGAAEVIKYGLLGDAALFDDLEKSPLTAASPTLAALIRRCCALKARIVEADERETAADGGRALLNLGHTFGHAVENAAGYGEYLHGEAVAIGLCAAARLSHKLGYVSAADVGRVERVVAAHALPVCLRAPLAFTELHAAMTRDKKVRAGGLRMVVLKRLGEAATQGEISPALIEQSFREVGAA